MHVRILQIIEACARDFDVTLVCPPPANLGDLSILPTTCKVRLLALASLGGPTASFFERLRRSVAALEPVGKKRARLLAEFERCIVEVDLAKFDLVWVERGFVAPLVRRDKNRAIIDVDDVEHVKFFRQAVIASSLKERLRQLTLAIMLFWREAVILRFYGAVAVCSEVDAARLRTFGHRRILVLENGTAVPSALRPRPAPSVELRAVFLGHMRHLPNLDAVRYFAASIRPHLAEQAPDAVLEVIGGGVDPADPPLTGRWLYWRGFVENLEEALARADVFIAPLRLGSGTKLKILDAMACGIPVVTTPVGAEGLDLRNREHAIIVTGADAFAAAMLEIWRDPDLAERLARNAHAHVRDRFDWPAIRGRAGDWLTHWCDMNKRKIQSQQIVASTSGSE